MASTLKVVNEVEVPPEAVEVQAPAPVAKSAQSSEASHATAMILAEIRKILSARAAALVAMVGAFCLTASSMFSQSWMSLAIAVSYDMMVFLPMALIAYRTPK